jgi:pimeloyl-ACP methyl ester carboxylesterase
MRVAKATTWIVVSLMVTAGVGFLMRPVSYFDGMLYVRDAMAGARSRSVRVNGYRMHYLVEGPADGQVVVLVHGLGGRAEDWRNLAPYLVKAGFRVVMPDLVGYGRSATPRDFSYSIRDEADLVIAFLDALGLKQVDLGGWSMGGWIVQRVAGKAPGRVNRLILFDSAGLYAVPDWDTRLFTPSNAQQLGQLNALLTPHPQNIPGFVAADILRISKQRGWVVKRAMAAMWTGRDVTDALLPQLKMPVLIAWGAKDQIVPVDQAAKIHRLVPQSELDVIAGCGHIEPVECTSVIGPKVVAFLKQ